MIEELNHNIVGPIAAWNSLKQRHVVADHTIIGVGFVLSIRIESKHHQILVLLDSFLIVRVEDRAN